MVYVCEECQWDIFADEHLKNFYYGSTLTNKYCKTGVHEHTLLRSWFVKTWNIFNTGLIFTPEVYLLCKKVWDARGPGRWILIYP